MLKYTSHLGHHKGLFVASVVISKLTNIATDMTDGYFNITTGLDHQTFKLSLYLNMHFDKFTSCCQHGQDNTIKFMSPKESSAMVLTIITSFQTSLLKACPESMSLLWW